MSFSPLINQLIESLRCLPGVGQKTAQRMAFSLLSHQREKAKQLAQAIHQAVENIHHCKKCRIFSESELCPLCGNPRRDSSLLCIVETPADVMAIEKSNFYKGLYFVLLGKLSPIDGIGPQEIGMHQLRERLSERIIQEVIIATNLTAEGEATAHYITELAKPYQIKVSKIARGIPLGGELEYIDSQTIAEALNRRSQMG